jgi:hypothetical protein
MASVYLIGRRNTGAALFNNSKKVPFLFKSYRDARMYLDTQVLTSTNQEEVARWFVKKFDTDKQVTNNIAFAVCSQRLGRGSYAGVPFMIAVFSSRSAAENYVSANSPQSFLGKFFADYRLIVQEWEVR